MSQSLSSSSGGPAASSSGPSEGIHASPDGVGRIWKHTVPGWSEPVGTVSNIRFGDVERLEVQGRTLRFQPFFFDHMTLEHTAHLMVLQGLPVSQLFSGMFRTMDPVDKNVVSEFLPGPWVFLGGTMSPPWAVPILRNVVLVKLFDGVEKDIAGELLKALVDRVLNRA